MNKEILQDIRFGNIVAGADSGPFQWLPDRIKDKWTSLDGQTWTGEYATDLAATLGFPVDNVKPFLRPASDSISLPMTILWALEKLSPDDGWMRKETLTVHLLGATQEELIKSHALEEIMHRSLPIVSMMLLLTCCILKIILCGPGLADLGPAQFGQSTDIETCPTCRKRGRKRIHALHAEVYHDFINKQGVKFINPDVAVAFNSGAGSEETASWSKSIEVMVQKKIPTLFTSFNHEEAERDSKLLASLGAQLNPALGPERNPWGSLLSRTEPHKVRGYYGCNRSVAGAFS